MPTLERGGELTQAADHGLSSMLGELSSWRRLPYAEACEDEDDEAGGRAGEEGTAEGRVPVGVRGCECSHAAL